MAWWRQAAASITKERFTPRERANFNMDDIGGLEEEVVEEEGLLVDLAESSNHSFRTFNMAYAGSTTLTMSTLLHRAHRASLSWRSLFQVDELLAQRVAGRPGLGAAGGESRKRGEGSDDDGDDPLRAYKRMRLRKRPFAKEASLQGTARTLHGDATLQLRRPGQRDAMLAVMGPRAAEQVIVVLGTGSGKSLIIIVAAVMEGAGTTVLVLPTVALRTNMLQRAQKMGIRILTWSPGQTRAAPLVVVSAEAACSQGFSDYVHKGRYRMLSPRNIRCHDANDLRRRRPSLEPAVAGDHEEYENHSILIWGLDIPDPTPRESGAAARERTK